MLHSKTKQFHCTQCNYAGSQSSHLKQHLATIHNKEKRLQFVQCVYVSSVSGDLKKHMGTHSDEKKFFPFKVKNLDQSTL